MEGRKARVVISSTQIIDGQADSIREEYDAYYLSRNGKHYFTYEKEDEDKPIKVLATISEDLLVIKQTGRIETLMQFKKYESFANDYQTPFGCFKPVTDTRDYELEVGEEELNLKLAYFLDMQQGKPIQTELKFQALFE
ncbi:MAG: DUF1934 domain-containing protein [Pseudobutyrivibrio sp.]|nr:DUF1934 domain-containing protein [Pseudobutyrivibrio sp.]